MPNSTLTSSKDTGFEFVAPKTKIHTFTDVISDKNLLFQVIKLQDSLMIYVNDVTVPCFNNLTMAINTRFSSDPSTAQLLGSNYEQSGTSIASRIAKKVNKAVFLSLNIKETRFVTPLVEKRLNEEINKNPKVF